MSHYDDNYDAKGHHHTEESEKIVDKEVDKENVRETFEPICESSLLASKSLEEISNASQNNGFTGEPTRQRLFNVSDERLFESVVNLSL